MTRLDHNGVTILCGDVREALRSLADCSVQCVVTSPPYWCLRDYGVDGQIGLEQTPDEYVVVMVDVFREVWRVLSDDGVLWLNLGDSYASGGMSEPSGKSTLGGGRFRGGQTLSRKTPFGLKHKDLVGIPWRTALALQADGWYLRQDIIWHKPNPMPESVRDRCTKAHEYLFLLTKSASYYWDHEAMQEKAVWGCGNVDRPSVPRGRFNGKTEAIPGRNAFRAIQETRNRRSVWEVPTQPYAAAHFAAFPPKLIEPCILAGSREGDTVLDPFGGSGTTAMVAIKLWRRATMIELNPEYIELAKARIGGPVLPFAESMSKVEDA